MTAHHRTPASWQDLMPGTRVFVSSDSCNGLRTSRWAVDGTAVPGTIISKFVVGGCFILLDEAHVYAFSLSDSATSQTHCDKKFLTNVKATDQRLHWVVSYDAVRLQEEEAKAQDPHFLSETTVYGNFTCQCGAMNTDVSATSIIKGKYVCYMCRVIMPRERAA